MYLPTLSPQQVAEKLKQGATLIDIRSHAEYRTQHIKGAICYPIEQMNAQNLPQGEIIFHCLGGMRTQHHSAYLAQCCSQAYILEGGLNAWQKAGFPIQKSGKLDIMRQVQIIAGSLVVLGVLMGAFISPYFYILSAMVGLGLMVAGLTGFCGMARLLAVLPYNKQ